LKKQLLSRSGKLCYYMILDRMKTSKKAKTATTKSKASSGVSKVRQSILDAYIAQLQKTGKAHVSVHSLCLDLKIREKEFYGEFPSLSAVEKHFWKEWIERIIDAVSSGKEWGAFSAKEQYLAFLFAFAGEALEHRSLLEQRFAKLTLLCSPDTLDGLKSSFKDFAVGIIARGMESGEIAHRGPLGNVYRKFSTSIGEAYWSIFSRTRARDSRGPTPSSRRPWNSPSTSCAHRPLIRLPTSSASFFLRSPASGNTDIEKTEILLRRQ
jgi:hypothetical protein